MFRSVLKKVTILIILNKQVHFPSEIYLRASVPSVVFLISERGSRAFGYYY